MRAVQAEWLVLQCCWAWLGTAGRCCKQPVVADQEKSRPLQTGNGGAFLLVQVQTGATGIPGAPGYGDRGGYNRDNRPPRGDRPPRQ